MLNINNQILIFFFCFLIGFIAVLFYNLFKYIKKWAKNNVFICFLLDFAVFFVSGLSIFIVGMKFSCFKFSFIYYLFFALGFAFGKFSIINFINSIILNLSIFIKNKRRIK